VYKAKLKPEILGVMPSKEETASGQSMTQGVESDTIPSTSVAIKVLHPKVHSTIRRDIAIMSIFANALTLFPGMVWLSLPEEVEVFGEMMNSQLDLRVESANLDKFDRNFAKRGRRVTFPKPIRLGGGEVQGNRGEVMIEEYEDALPLKYFLRNGGGPYDDKIANIGLDAFLVSHAGWCELVTDGVRKCCCLITGHMEICTRKWTLGLDLGITLIGCSGNIMVRFYKPNTKDLLGPLLSRFTSQPTTTIDAIPTQSQSANDLVHTLSAVAHEPEAWHARLSELNQQGYEPQLIFIDAGLVTTLDTTNRKNFLDLFQAIAEFDGYRAGKLMVERCRTPEHVIDEETFALKIQHLVLSVKSKTFSLASIKISDILTDVLTAVRQHHVKMEGDFVNTVISILLLEGIGRQLDPDMDLFKSALPILRQLGRQMGTREAISAVPKGNIWAMAKVSRYSCLNWVGGMLIGCDSFGYGWRLGRSQGNCQL
jgi:aarF domain-containing kinase